MGHASPQRVLPDHQKHHGGDHAVHGQVEVQGPELAALHTALHDALDEVMARQHDFLVIELREFGEIARLAEHQLGDAGGLGIAYALPPGAKAVAQKIAGGRAVVVQLLAPFGKAPGDGVAHHGLEKLLLAREIQEQRALGHAGARSHFLDARGGIALFDKEVESGFEQFAGAFLLAPAAFAAGFGQSLGRGGGRGHGKLMTDGLVILTAVAAAVICLVQGRTARDSETAFNGCGDRFFGRKRYDDGNHLSGWRLLLVQGNSLPLFLRNIKNLTH